MRLTRRGSLIVCLALVASALSCACNTPHMIGGKIDPADVKQPGIRYHLGRDVVVVDVTVTRRIRVITNAQTKEVIASDEVSRSAKGTVSLKTVPDHSSMYVIWMRPGGAMDNSIGVIADAGGTLRSVNVGSVDRSAEAIGNLIQFAARVAGAATGLKPLKMAAEPDVEAEATEYEEVRELTYSIPIEKVPESLSAQALGDSTIAEMFRESGILVTARRMDTDRQQLETSEGYDDLTGLNIYYRPTEPYVITVWSSGPQWSRKPTEKLTSLLAAAPGQRDKPPTMRILSERVFNVLRPKAAAYVLTNSETAFSTQALAIGFDEAGRLLSVTRSGTSPVAGFAAGLNGASTSAATGLENGLELRKSIVQNEKDILLLKKEIEALKDAK